MIYYVTTDNRLLEVDENDFNAPIFKHEYYKDKEYGEIVFMADVTIIGDSAFRECETLERIIIPETVTEIGDYAFYDCESLVSINIPNGITEIGEYLFYGCESLMSINIPDGVAEIGERAFKYCESLTSVTIPNSVTEIGEGAFSDCLNLTSVTIPNSVTSVGVNAFRDCTNLESVTIGNSVTSIGNYAFYGCESLATIYCKPTAPPTVDSFMSANYAAELKIYVPFESIDAYKTAEGWAWWYANSTIIGYDFESMQAVGGVIFYTTTDNTTVLIGNRDAFGAQIVSNTYKDGKGCIVFDSDVTSIGDYAFSYLYSNESSNLASIIIPDSVTEIGWAAFCDCGSLESITIPDGITSIEGYAFVNCSSLAEFNGKLASKDGRCLIIDGVLHSFAPARLTEYTIPNGVTSIGNYAFLKCSSLASINIPDSVTEIGNDAFENCYNLASVSIGNDVTSIGSSAFRECSSLASINIPDSVTSIGSSAFAGCTSLTSVTIGNGVTEIGYSAFKDVTGELILNNKKMVETDYDNYDGLLYTWFSHYTFTSIVIGDIVTSIGNYAFCSSISFGNDINPTSITIPNSVTEIGEFAFFSCDLVSITIPDSVTKIGESAFWGSDSLTSVTIGNGVTLIEDCAFYDCNNLSEVYCKPTTPPAIEVNLGWWTAFDNNAMGRKIYVPHASVNAYKSAKGWRLHADSIVGYDFE